MKTLPFDLAVEWFRNYSNNADHLPNSTARPLPSCLSKKAVYQIYKEEMGDRPTLSRSHFIYKMWKKNFPDIYIPKVCLKSQVHLAEQRKSLQRPNLDVLCLAAITIHKMSHLCSFT